MWNITNISSTLVRGTVHVIAPSASPPQGSGPSGTPLQWPHVQGTGTGTEPKSFYGGVIR